LTEECPTPKIWQGGLKEDVKSFGLSCDMMSRFGMNGDGKLRRQQTNQGLRGEQP